MIYGQFVYNYCNHRGEILSTNENNELKINPSSLPEILGVNLVKNQNYWQKLGIQGPSGLIFEINGIKTLLGPAGVYEINDYEIKTFKIIDFSTGKNIIIDYGY